MLRPAGSRQYKEPIAESQEEVDRLNEERLEKTNRVKLVEREKAALEHAKKEADAYLRDLNELAKRQSELYQVYQMRYNANIAAATQSVEKATQELLVERDSQAGIRQEVAELEQEHRILFDDHRVREGCSAAISYSCSAM